MYIVFYNQVFQCATRPWIVMHSVSHTCVGRYKTKASATRRARDLNNAQA